MTKNTPASDKAIDIANIAPVERTVELVHPGTNEPLGIKFTLMSTDDPRLKAAQRQVVDLRNQRAQRNKPMKAAELEANIIRLLAKTIIRWDWGGRTYNDEVPEYSEAKAIEILTNSPWIFAQINDEVGDAESFFRT